MKKTLSLTLVMIFVLSFMAVANPFSDVPFSHWAYDAVAKLSARGIITGFPDGTFKGQRTVTRYELAMILARLMAKMDTPGGLPANFSLEDRRTVERLTVELADELSLLGVKVTALEDEVAVLKDDVAMMKEGHGGSCGSSMGALKVSGEFVLDYNDFDYDNAGTERGFRNFYTIDLEAKPMK
ncbi:MAG: S-layer homology domain-containing protein, partial [Candidatus Muiribacteriota bacterium]